MNMYETAIIDAIVEITAAPDAGRFDTATRFEADLGFDSGSFIELFLILEETIPGFSLGTARLEQKDFDTVALLATFIERRMNELEAVA